MNPADPNLAFLRGQVAGIILGTIFLFIGIASCVVAAVRRRGQVQILVWFGLFSGLYGARMLAQSPLALAVLPQSTWSSRPYVNNIVAYLIIVPGALFWLEFTQGLLRRFVQITIAAGSLIGIAGVVSLFVAGPSNAFMFYNHALAICYLLVIGAVLVVPRLSLRFLTFSSPVLTVGILVFAAAALYINVGGLLDLEPDLVVEQFALALFIFSLGYVSADKVFRDERRLLAIQSELEIAREIQNSILPTGVPDLKNLSIAAAYHPMTAVAGDFYEFIPVDQYRAGFLVADVSGHGVPAALIASMIKVAVQSAAASAQDPAEVLRILNRILSGQLRGQFVTAAYLWIDTEAHKARYAAAGHPPLLSWRAAGNELTRIESNGLPLGVAGNSDYAACDVPLASADRFLLYTDGVIEPENAAGEPFGDCRLEQVVRSNHACSPSELSRRLLAEVRNWQPASVPQQDDITLIVIDVL